MYMQAIQEDGEGRGYILRPPPGLPLPPKFVFGSSSSASSAAQISASQGVVQVLPLERHDDRIVNLSLANQMSSSCRVHLQMSVPHMQCRLATWVSA